MRRVGDSVHYLLAKGSFGRRAASDLVLAEVNRAEMTESPAPGRVGYVFAEISTPSRTLLFDVHVHGRLYAGAAAELSLYDTTFDGIVDVNDPEREIDRLDLAESLTELGPGLGRVRTPAMPRYHDLTRHVCGRLGWSAADFRTYRCEIDYPLYGSQVVVSFGAPPAAP